MTQLPPFTIPIMTSTVPSAPLPDAADVPVSDGAVDADRSRSPRAVLVDLDPMDLSMDLGRIIEQDEELSAALEDMRARNIRNEAYAARTRQRQGDSQTSALASAAADTVVMVEEDGRVHHAV